ncbi:sulfite exporter TauE/SafE family protein [Micrococcus luteus]|uniref:sulfite exporter TauE/SafE family protein n=1 Tax=Micrococcus luteus TaxID=1270 RepID=UPI0019CF767C|nr:sulfite exporter TauE/SafE family protein [Micrococcus luteus]MBN6766907.1 sulfite exporter TauE/SafE family protein [Micrococcus luteus]MBN6827955.1 sulfite exporter TauE/SafE family protein [Micrococcus luteus]MBN6844812.1 sulfite exporter TauE/SafE family protein [Micrococcus luteus]MBN6861361.1 sulfite exporter TauE/SafE family protein [Micrococcus luteus]MBN6863453.1 sulfite exporter TauE/SafE family protein [Micrococcus luteus]
MTGLLTVQLLGMDLWQVLLVLLAGFWAGTINSVIGSGTLVTFPTLVAVGFPPVTAQVSNAMGLVASGFSGTYGYRRELAQSRVLLPKLTVASLLGGVIGAALLTTLPPAVFGYVAPVLLVVALTVVVLQPRIQRWVRRRAEDQGPTPGADSPVPVGPVTPTLWTLVFLTGIYGGYFVAAQGVMLMAIFGVLLVGGTLVHANAVKTWLSLVVNLTAAAFYLVFAFDRIDWRAVLLIALSSLVGGLVGARIGRRISPTALRVTIVIVGLAGLVVMVMRQVSGG